ncbi:hypothetical protein BM535_23425, partial [Clostridioides difficile]
GDFVGFEVGFMKWIVSMIAWATMANFFAVTLSSVWPQAAEPLIKKYNNWYISCRAWDYKFYGNETI